MNTEGLAEFHREMMVFDMHSDIPCEIIRRRSLGETEVLNNVFLDPMMKGGVDAFVVSIPANLFFYPSRRFSDHLEGGLNCIDVMYSDVEECCENFVLAADVKEIKKANKAHKIAIVMGFEGGEPLGRELQNLRNFYRLGVRLIQLTWNYRNAIGDGVGERSGSGISPFGVEVIEEMNRLGMVIDLSHITAEGFMDALDVTKAPVLVSHTACDYVNSHVRNLTDEQLQLVGETGGMVGIAFFPDFFSSNDTTLSMIIDHIDHAVEVIGPDAVGIGPDFIDYCQEVMCAEFRHVSTYGNNLKYPGGAEDVRDLPNVTGALFERGYSEREVKGIMGENFLEFLSKVLR